MAGNLWGRALELARTGRYNSYVGIEHELESMGFRNARRYLDSAYHRQELRAVCEQAQTPEEQQRRTNFSDWIDRIESDIQPKIKEKRPDISISVSTDSVGVEILIIRSHSFHHTIRLHRAFGKPLLRAEMDCRILEDNLRDEKDLSSYGNFDFMDDERIIDMIITLTPLKE